MKKNKWYVPTSSSIDLRKHLNSSEEILKNLDENAPITMFKSSKEVFEHYFGED